jgi:hypothetical protein
MIRSYPPQIKNAILLSGNAYGRVATFARVTICACTANRHLSESGYTMRRARQVLTSSDPNYRAKVEVILQTLGDTETLFFIDELGPLAVKKHGGRSFVKKGRILLTAHRWVA